MATCFSNSFDNTGRIDISLQFPGSSFSPFLKIGVTFAHFSFYGKLPLIILKLMKCVSDFVITGVAILRIC